MKTALIAAFALLLAGVAPPVGAQARPSEHHIRTGGADRSYLLVAPATAGPAPLVIALHGGGGNAGTMVPRWLSKAEREGFVVAFPQGLGRNANMGTWNASGCCGYAMTAEVDDVAFIAAVIDDVSREVQIDPRRIYVAGLSNGGMLTHLVARELGPRLAGVAVVAGAMFDDGPPVAAPVPILILHGQRDEVVPYAGGRSPMALVARSQSRPFLPVEDVVKSWRRADGCEGEPRIQTEGDVTITVSSSCRDGAEVVFYRLASAGHGWPGPAPAVGGLERDRYEAVDATDVIWRFFSAHAR